jgi:hypothetical protein
MPDDGPDTILLDLFRTNQVRERLIESALEGVDLPPEDYPFYVLIGAEGPWTPTALAARMEMPLSTVLFRVSRLEKRLAARRPRRAAGGNRSGAQLRVRSATASTCGVCGNMSTGRTRSRR